MLVRGFFQKHGQLTNGYTTEETVSSYMSNFWLQPLKERGAAPTSDFVTSFGTSLIYNLIKTREEKQ